MKKILSNLILAIIFQNCLIAKVYASSDLIVQNETKQPKYKTFNSGNTPIHSNNTVEWFYNSLNQNLSSFSEEDTIRVIKESMLSWSNISGVKFVYKGKTSNNINDTTDGIITIGFWSNKAYSASIDKGDTFAWVAWDGTDGKVPEITEGYIILNAGDTGDNKSIPRNLLELQGLITHRVGHLLAIDHSDNKESIMFADPYHSFEYQTVLKSDDIKIASLLYPLNSNDLLTTVKSNFDIIIQSATFYSPDGTSNVWAILEFQGKDSKNDSIWKLVTYGEKESSSNEPEPLTAVRPNLDIIIQSATFYSPDGVSDVWAVLEFGGTDSNGDLIWKLKAYGNN